MVWLLVKVGDGDCGCVVEVRGVYVCCCVSMVVGIAVVVVVCLSGRCCGWYLRSGGRFALGVCGGVVE